MNKEEIQALLADRNGRAVALQGVKIRAHLHDLFASVELAQSYQNRQNVNIEAVYTFPLPIGAVLLGVEVEIANRLLHGKVVPKQEAEQRYEDAITDGDTAVMVQEAGPGLYTLNLGNLMAGESCTIRYRYGLVLTWQGGHVRFLLPTTLAPRYGDWADAGLQPHQQPQTSILVDYPLELEVLLSGSLAEADIACPSHPIAFSRSEAGLSVRLPENARLDRDFVLKLSACTESCYLLAQDEETQVALAALRIPADQSVAKRPLDLKIVIDCSGSMEGPSIAQARKAALAILDNLQAQDRFNVTLFGSSHQHMFQRSVAATAVQLAEARSKLEKLSADLGGTEIDSALLSAYALEIADRNAESERAVLLITDGQITNTAPVLKAARQSGHRVFTVGVGTAVSEAFVRELARNTGGACELVAPQEGMSERILLQFHRLRQLPVANLKLEWGMTPLWQTPLPTQAFAGDTVLVYAAFSRTPSSVCLELDNCKHEHTRIIQSPYHVEMTDLPRMAAAARIAASQNDKQNLDLAIRYQLLTAQTHFLVIAEREDKAEDLPALHQVEHMLAAGWGGSGDLCRGVSGPAPGADGMRRRMAKSKPAAFAANFMDLASMPAPCAAAAPMPQKEAMPDPESPQVFVEAFMVALHSIDKIDSLPDRIDALMAFGLPGYIATGLRSLCQSGFDERTIVFAFLMLVLEHLNHTLPPRELRALKGAWKRHTPSAELEKALRQALAGCHVSAWNWPSDALV